MDEFVRELKECASGLHDGMGGHADYCAALMKWAAKQIADLEENATAQALALKAAKAMQQAETERADANERDAERYRWLCEHGDGIGIYERSFGGDCWLVSDPDSVIDQAMKEM